MSSNSKGIDDPSPAGAVSALRAVHIKDAGWTPVSAPCAELRGGEPHATQGARPTHAAPNASSGHGERESAGPHSRHRYRYSRYGTTIRESFMHPALKRTVFSK